jgi:hypothetical protein
MANILKNKVRRLVNYDTSNFFSIMSKKNNIGSIDLKIKSSFLKKYFLTFLS